MIDWMAIKQAADISENDASFWNKDPDFQNKYRTYHDAFMKTPPDLRAENNIRPLGRSYNRMVHSLFKGKGFPTKPYREKRNPSMLTPQPVTQGTMEAMAPLTDGRRIPLNNAGGMGVYVNKSKINRALFGQGNEQAADYEQRRALDNRWRRMYQSSRWYHRPFLNFFRRIGYVPPIYMGGPDVAFPKSPNQMVKMSLLPGMGRSWANPSTGQVFIGARNGDTDRNILRASAHELAHIETPTWADRYSESDWDNFDESVVKGIPGSDVGEDRNTRLGMPGSYELNPSELTRMIYLQKAALERLGHAPIRTFDEWLDFMKQGGFMYNYSGKPVEEKELSNPFQTTGIDHLIHNVFGTGEYSNIDGRGENYLENGNSFSRSLLSTIQDLENIKNPHSIYTEAERAEAARQYEDIKRAVQDALDLS